MSKIARWRKIARLRGFCRAKITARGRMRDEKRKVEEWVRDGRPIPPPNLVKQRIVNQYGRDYAVKTLVETGTFLGDMVHACRKNFHRIASIELDPQLYQNASQRFESDRHIKIYEGDSASLLSKISEEISEPCLFWLDGHYSAGITAKGDLNTPIMDELTAICDHPIDGHVILIDDARCFTGEDDYPTVGEVRDFMSSRKPDYRFELDLDIMRITPPLKESGKDLLG
jgi:hypothetical protein